MPVNTTSGVPLEAHPNGKLFKFFLPQDPEFPIQRAVLAAWLPYFLGAEAVIESYDNQLHGFYYWAWRALTPAMVDDLKGQRSGTRPVPFHPTPGPIPPAPGPLGPPPSSYYSGIPGLEGGEGKPTPPEGLPLISPPDPSTGIDPADCAFDPAGNPYYHTKEGRYLSASEVQQVAASKQRGSGESPIATYDSLSMSTSALTGITHEAGPTTSSGYWTFDSSGKRIYVLDGQIVQYAD